MRHQFVAIMATVLTLMPCHAQDALPAHAIARLGDTKWKYPYGPSGLRFVNAGRDLLVQCGDGSLRFTEIVTGTTFPPAHFQGQRVLAVSTNGETIVRLSEDERSFVFETIHGRRLGSTPRNGDSNFGHVNLVNDRQFVAWNEFASGEQSLILFDIDGPNRIVYDKTNRPPDLTKVTPLLAVLPSPEGKRLAIAVSDPAPKRYGGKLFTWKTDGGYSTTSLDIDICSVDGCRSVVAAFSADGRLIGTLYNGKILINDVREFNTTAQMTDSGIHRR